jgi:hypothetical protein
MAAQQAVDVFTFRQHPNVRSCGIWTATDLFGQDKDREVNDIQHSREREGPLTPRVGLVTRGLLKSWFDW